MDQQSQPNQVNIEEKSTTYDIKLTYHSDAKCENYDAEIRGISESDNTITLMTKDGYWDAFKFRHSDPDRVIAIANMMLSFAQAIKYENSTVKDN